MHKPQSVVVSRTRLPRGAMVMGVSAATLLGCCGAAVGQVHPNPQWGPYGSNTQILRDPFFRFGPGPGFVLTGNGIRLGQVEGGRPGDAEVLDGAMNPEVNHVGINPGGGIVGTGDVQQGPAAAFALSVASPPPANDSAARVYNPASAANRFMFGAHPTQVAGVMGGNGGVPVGLPGGTQGVVGVASGATVWSGSMTFLDNSPAAPAPGPPIFNNTDASAIFAAEWVRARGTVATNMSFGFDPAGNPVNGQSLLSRYVDWTVNQNNQTIVVAGNEDPAGLLAYNRAQAIAAGNPPPTARIIPSDSFNSIVVGATTQRATGNDVRFDQVSNFTSPNFIDVPAIGGGTYRLGKTDILAPGGTSYSVQLQNTVTMVTRTWNDFNNYTPNANEVIVPGSAADVSGTSDVYMPTLLLPAVGNNRGVPGFTTSAGTSFSAPQVTGIVGLMQQYQTQVRGQVRLEAIDVKASLMNSASKHVLSLDTATAGSPTYNATSMTQAWPARYRARTANATNFAEGIDPEMGTGQANGIGAVRQIASGNGDTRFGSKLGDVLAGGTSTLMLNAGYGTLTAGSLVTATLAWNRNVTNPNAGPNNADLVNPAKYNSPNLPNDLDLRLVNRATGAIIAASRSFYSSTEHLYFNVPADGDYNLEFKNWSGNDQHYAIAYATGSSDGMTFTSARSYTNPIQGTGVLGGFGNNAFPNDVNALGYAGQGQYEIGGELFTSDLSGTNQHRLSGALGTDSRVGPHIGAPAAMNILSQGAQRGVLGLQSGDQMAGLSFGRDGSAQLNPTEIGSTLTFSVDNFASGVAGTDAHFQAVLSPPVAPPGGPYPTNPGGGGGGMANTGHEAAGDVFVTPVLPQFGAYTSAKLAPALPGLNRLHIDESKLGLQAPASNGGVAGMEDNLTDFDHDSIRAYADSDSDGIHNKQVFFSLEKSSPSLAPFNAITPNTGAANVYVSHGTDFGGAFFFNVFAPFAFIGLQPFDGIDAIIMSDLGGPAGPDGILQRGLDTMLFSLDPGSPSGSPGDIYFTDFNRLFQPLVPWFNGGSLFATAGYLGLNPADNIDGLDIWTIPAPGSGTLLALAGLMASRRRRRAV